MVLARTLNLLLASVAVAGLLTAQSVPPAKQAEARFSIAITVEPTTVKTGSPLTVNVILTNKSKDTIYLDVSAQWMAELDFRIEVRDDQGNLAAVTDYGRNVIKHEGGIPIVENYMGVAVLHPGETLKREISISKLYNLNRPGKYTIQAQRIDDNKAAAKSNTVTVTVTSPE